MNQSSLQTNTTEEDQPPTHDKLDFSERLGSLNKRWQSLNQDVTSELKNLEMLHSKWDEYEKCLTKVQDWFHQQEDKVKQYRLIGHEVSIKQTIKECKVSE